MEQKLKEKLEYCAKLLADSMLDEEIKGVIVETVGKMTEADLDNIIESLEREKDQMEKLADAIGKIDEIQKEKWDTLEESQKAKAKEMIEEFVQELSKKE